MKVPRRLTALQVWGTDGALRTRGRLAGGSPASGGEPERAEAEHVARALAGETSSFAVERDGQVYECLYAPLVATTDGSVEGAVSLLFTEGEVGETPGRRRAFQELITELSTKFVNLAGEEIDRELTAALRSIGEFAGVDRAYIFRSTPDGAAMDNTHEWCAEGIEPQIDMLQGLLLTTLPWWARNMRARSVIDVPDVDLLPEEERRFLQEQGILSVLAIPMIYQDRVVGFVGFDSVRRRKSWPKADVALLRIAGEIFVNAIERARSDRQREQLEAELVQARSMENVARLAGGVAHDFNNLLAIILNYAALLRHEIVDPGQREKLDELVSTAQRAAHLTRQMLLVGRRDIVTPVPLILTDVIVGLEGLLRQTIGDSIELVLELDDDLEVVRVGLPQIEQVFLNLTLNARDAMPRGGRLLISADNVDIGQEQAAHFIDVQPGRYVHVRIQDDGAGMPSDVAARAFEPFFTTKGASGTGLGLSSVHGIVRQAGGHARLSTEVGVGTTIDLFFPAITSPVPVASPVEAAPSTAPALGRGETVLVVDDSKTSRHLVCQLLQRQRYVAVDAGTPEEAIAICEARRGAIDLLLTDVIMPQMSGRDLATRLREDYGVPRVLFMSGYDDETISRHGVLEEGALLLPKPFLEADLLRAVRSALDAAEAEKITA